MAITTAKGAHLTIALSALTYSQGAITISGWTAPDSDAQTAAQNWANYLLGEGELAPVPPVTTAPGVAFLLEAAHPGAMSSNVSVTISGVTKRNPPDASTLDMSVSVTNKYTGLKLETLGSTIGTTAGGGSAPGLVFLSSADPPTDLPVKSASPVAMSGATPKADIAAGTGTAFTLTGVADIGPGITFTVAVPNDPVAGVFEIDVTWSLSVTNKRPSELPALFQSVVKITAPPAGFGAPVEDTYPLQGGADPDPMANPPAPALPAKNTVPSA
ncbi:MAG TPA: hypothetical protein VG986_18510 [Pseudolabrys sp.]|nr:hypothetical protein [Pseudolabrys sp.]